jgi:hypothetical protein
MKGQLAFGLKEPPINSKEERAGVGNPKVRKPQVKRRE